MHEEMILTLEEFLPPNGDDNSTNSESRIKNYASFSWKPKCNVSAKMEHAGIAHGTTVGLSVPNFLKSLLELTPVTLAPEHQVGHVA